MSKHGDFIQAEAAIEFVAPLSHQGIRPEYSRSHVRRIESKLPEDVPLRWFSRALLHPQAGIESLGHAKHAPRFPPDVARVQCSTRGDLAEQRTQKFLEYPEYYAAIRARAWTTNVVWPPDEQECVAFAVVRVIAFAKAADDYLRTCDDEQTIILNELLAARALSFEALVTEALKLLQRELIKRVH